jgi:hypothetical protein
MVWGSEPPAFSIGYDAPMGQIDSGFTVLFDDAPDPDDLQGRDDPRISWVCVGCLLEEHPELARGLDIARRHQLADLDEDGAWVIGDLRRQPI